MKINFDPLLKKLKTAQSTTPQFDQVIEFDTNDPNVIATIFTPEGYEATVNVLYVSQVDNKTWRWDVNTGVYETYEIAVPNNTPFWLYGTTIDAGGNKTALIQRNGPVFINSSSSNGSRYAAYLYSRRTSGAGNGVLIRKDLRTTSGNYLLVQGWNSSTNETQDKLKVGHNGDVTINAAYTLPTADGTAGQVLKTDGTGNITWGASGAGYVRRHETTADYDYLGYAPTGALDSDTTWSLTRLTLSSSGISAVMTATDSWDNRATATYV